jgi:hypothetical protein
MGQLVPLQRGVNHEAPVYVLQEARGDVFAEASANHIPDAAAALDGFAAMSEAARALQDAWVRGLQPGAEHVSGVYTAGVIAQQDKVLATLLYHEQHHKYSQGGG